MPEPSKRPPIYINAPGIKRLVARGRSERPVTLGFAELAPEDSAAELIRRADAELPTSLRS